MAFQHALNIDKPVSFGFNMPRRKDQICAFFFLSVKVIHHILCQSMAVLSSAARSKYSHGGRRPYIRLPLYLSDTERCLGGHNNSLT